MRVYTPVVPVEPAPQTPPPLGDPGTGLRRRRLPNPAEQARRQAWGKKWGQAGKALNRRIRESG